MPTLSFRVVVLLAVAVFINYVDRGSLATAAPLIQDELQLTPTQMGVLLSSFFWSYTPLQPVAGWLAHRFDVRWVYGSGLALWSVATAMTGWVGGFTGLLALRVLVGIGESVTFPCNATLLAQGLPESKRGLANGIVSVGFGLGPAFGTLVGGLLMAHLGWRAGFLAFGLASLLWLWPWCTSTRGLRVDTRHSGPTVVYLDLLRRRAVWGTSLGHFCGNYGIYFVLTWLPLYLVKARGFSVEHMSYIGAAVYSVYALTSALTGWISDRWLATGASVNRVRKTVICTGMLGAAAAILLLCLNVGTVTSIALFALAAGSFGLVSPQMFAIAQTLAGPRAAGKWMGVQNMVGNFAGILAPLITGLVVDRTGEYFYAFAAVGVVALLGVLSWGVLVPRLEPLQWRFP